MGTTNKYDDMSALDALKNFWRLILSRITGMN